MTKRVWKTIVSFIFCGLLITQLIMPVYAEGGENETTYSVIYTDGVVDEVIFEDQITDNLVAGDVTPEFTGVPERDNYTFLGWDPEVAETVQPEDANEGFEIIYTATWEETPLANDKYKVIYTDGVEGEEIFEDQITEDLSVGDATPDFAGSTEREYYTFLGWDPAVAETVQPEDANENFEIIYTATWEETPLANDKYKVIYTDGVDDEDIFEDQITEDLSAGDATPEFTGSTEREYYTFSGWDPEVAETVQAEDASEDLEIVYTAKWMPTAYTVIYRDGKNGAIFKDVKFKGLQVGDDTPAFSGSTEVKNYIFDGWTKTIVSTVKAEDANDDLEIIYTAKWLNDSNNNLLPDNEEKNTAVGKTSPEALSVLKAVYQGNNSYPKLDGMEIHTVLVKEADIKSKGFKAAVQEKLDEAEENTGVITRVVVPSGTYSIRKDGALNIYTNTILDCRGTGMATPYDTSDDYDSVIINTAEFNGCVVRAGKKSDEKAGYGAYKNMTILGGTYSGNGSTGGSQIRFGHSTNVRVIGVKVLDNVRAHHMELGAVNGVLVADSVFKGFNKDEASGEQLRSIEAIQLDITHREKENFNGYAGLPPNENTDSSFKAGYDDLPTINATITKCHFEDVRRGVGSHHAVLGKYYTNIKITNNTFKDIPDRCINAAYFKNSEISGNTMTNVVSGIFVCSMIPKQFYQPRQDNGCGNALKTAVETLNGNVKVTNNKITLNADLTMDTQYGDFRYGIKAGGDKLTADMAQKSKDISFKINDKPMVAGNYYYSGITISNNTVTVTGNAKSVDYGIIGWYLKNSSITNNTVNLSAHNKDASSSAGIKANFSSGLTISGNNISGVTNGDKAAGIFAADSSSNLQITNNTIAACAKNGIEFSKLSADGKSNITGNKITSPKKNGIDIYQSKVNNILNNTVTGSGKDGITLSSKSTAASIQGNTIKNAKEFCLSLKDASKCTNIKNNKITGNNASKDGMYIAGKSKVTTISGNTIDGKVMNAIRATDASTTATTITGNTIKGKATHGIQVANGAASDVISKNTIGGMSGSGIVVAGKGTKVTNTIFKNTITGTNTGKNAIIIDNLAVVKTISTNTVKGKFSNGICINAGAKATTICKNTITGATKHGIFVYGKKGSLSTVTRINDNTISKCKGFGINDADFAKVNSIQGNKLKSNKKNTPVVTTGNKGLTFVTYNASVKVKKTLKLKTIASSASGKITYKTSNKKIATVSAKGVVKGVKKGTCTITATKNGISVTCKITVK